MEAKSIRNLFFLLFAISGFSGLIYESIWSHYLKLFLGHAAYAQSLVIAIFMAGMAAGSWIASKYSGRWKNLLLGYAVVEGVIGVMGLLFHSTFVQVTDIAYYAILPKTHSIPLVHTVKWTIACLLILPQSILLGMTFPLMSAGIIRSFPERPGASLAMLYFTNSLGAAIGVLTSAFLLIELVGLPGTVLTAGLINVLLAVIVWQLVKGRSALAKTESIERRHAPAGSWHILLLIVALLTGMASFIYEIGWIRMLSLVLGSSTHAFELMLSAFIFGLAFGGLWIRRRIDQLRDTIRFLGFVQIIMGLFAMSTLLVYSHSFEFMQWILKVLSKTEAAYLVFNLFSHLVALSIMLPVTFCAGMTLPLITYALLNRGHGEGSIGRVYAANTVGAIFGVLAAIHIGMPMLGLKGLIVAGASIDIALGALLLWRQAQRQDTRVPALSTAIGVAAVLSTLAWVELDTYKMASGVYRYGKLLAPDFAKVLYHKDGKTATVDLVDTEGTLSIRTNGKTDAAIAMAKDVPPSMDESTMVMIGAIALSIHPQARTAANIGMGSGLTTHTLLAVPWLERVDTIEIEPAMVKAAEGFRPRVEAAFADPRSHIFIDDAKTFFSTHNRKYDIIVSEPSNPWVSGTASLFSEEFYRLVSRYLNKNGIFVQWMQLYEINAGLVASVLKALSPQFSDYVIYGANDRDILVVARNHGKVPDTDPRVLEAPKLAELLRGIDIHSVQDFELRRIGRRAALEPLFASFPTPANSDYFPILDLNAAKARFLGSSAAALIGLGDTLLPVMEMLGVTHEDREQTAITPSSWFPRANSARAAMALRDFFINGHFTEVDTALPAAIRRDAQLLRVLLENCEHVNQWDVWLGSLSDVALAIVPHLTPNETMRVWKALGIFECDARLSTTQRHWLALLQAVSQRDAGGMAAISDALLSNGAPNGAKQLDYVLAAGMLGNIARGSPEEALRLWNTYRAKTVGARRPSMLFRLLLAHSGNLGNPSPRTVARGQEKPAREPGS